MSSTLTYEQARADHAWNVPEQYNIAADVCDRHPRDKLAMIHEDYSGNVRRVFTVFSSKGGQGVTVAVVDRSGQLRALLRGDGSPPHGIELARRKAYTARTFRRPSLEWAKRSEGDLAGQRNLAEVIPLGGGVPIAVGNDVIGAIGVSGSGGQQDDENCAKGAIAKVADQLK